MDIVCSLRNNLLSHKTAIQITTNEPQSCVFCEGVKPSFTKYTLLHLVFESARHIRKSRYPKRDIGFFWYAGRDSNPQPSEPESDALSIEPPAHLFDSLTIIAGFWDFVKREIKIILPVFIVKTVVFSIYM